MIVSSAIVKDGVIYTGKRHCDIFRNALPYGCLKNAEQGFVDDEGEFYFRDEAAYHAYNCGQIKVLKSELFSEDLW